MASGEAPSTMGTTSGLASPAASSPAKSFTLMKPLTGFDRTGFRLNFDGLQGTHIPRRIIAAANTAFKRQPLTMVAVADHAGLFGFFEAQQGEPPQDKLWPWALAVSENLRAENPKLTTAEKAATAGSYLAMVPLKPPEDVPPEWLPNACQVWAGRDDKNKTATVEGNALSRPLIWGCPAQGHFKVTHFKSMTATISAPNLNAAAGRLQELVQELDTAGRMALPTFWLVGASGAAYYGGL